jgi:hypothetical protein
MEFTILGGICVSQTHLVASALTERLGTYFLSNWMWSWIISLSKNFILSFGSLSLAEKPTFFGEPSNVVYSFVLGIK